MSLWAKHLESTNELMYFDFDVRKKFELAFCTKFGRYVATKYNLLICLDSTHHLFTLVTQNENHQGVPVAFLLSSDGKTDTIAKFLAAFKKIVLVVGTFMTDNDVAEMNSIAMTFPESNHLLCYWHILKTWKLKLRITSFDFKKDSQKKTLMEVDKKYALV